MVRIPAGYADIGSIEPEGRPDEWPRHRVYLDQFHIAKREVTVEQYCLFLNEYGMLGRDGRPRVNLGHPSCPLIKRGKNYLPKPDMAERPMVCVSWYGALAFARAAGGRLPTAAEWEKAAIFTVPNPPGDYLASLGRTESVPVAIAQPGVLGMRGLVGNVWEWCSDWYAADYYAASPAANPVGPPLGKEKELRGGSWASAETSKRIKNRHKAPAPAYFRTVGFRVVKD
jgi:formylglycine-generating enzyme required for sulfatase activity